MFDFITLCIMLGLIVLVRGHVPCVTITKYFVSRVIETKEQRLQEKKHECKQTAGTHRDMVYSLLYNIKSTPKQ